MGGGGGEAEEEVGFAALRFIYVVRNFAGFVRTGREIGPHTHDYQIVSLFVGELRGGLDGVEETVEAAVVFLCFRVACCCDDADLGVVAHEDCVK